MQTFNETAETMNNHDLSLTAIHEAGHYVAGNRYDILSDTVTIEPDPDAQSLGSVLQEDSHWTPDEAQKQVTTYCAGYAAVVAAGFDAVTAELGCGDDFEKAERIIELWGLPDLDTQKAIAVELMSQDRNRQAVESLVQELLTRHTLDADFADVLISYADGGCSESEWIQFRDVIYPTVKASNARQ